MSSFQIKYETTWYTSLPVILGSVFLILCLVSLKADKDSPWIWQQLNFFFTFLIETVLIPIKLAGWELCGAIINLGILFLIILRVKQSKSIVDDLFQDKEILEGHIEWLDDMMQEKKVNFAY